MHREKINKNVLKLRVVGLLAGLSSGLFGPVLVLFFLDRGISFELLMILMAAMNLSTFLLEIPGGVVADRFSRKWSITIGKFCYVLAVALILTTVNPSLLVLAFVLYGAGESFVSGADSALLFDSLEEAGQKESFGSVVGSIISLQLVATVIGTVGCGIAVSYAGLSGPFVSSLVVCILGAGVSGLLTEPDSGKQMQTGGRSVKTELHEYRSHVGRSIRFIGSNRSLLVLVFLNVVVLRAIYFVDRPFAQPHLASFGYDHVSISYLYTGFTLASALFARLSNRFGGSLDQVGRFAPIILIGFVSLLVVTNAPTGVVAVCALFGIHATRGLFQPMIRAALNRDLPSDLRASCLSVAQMGNNILSLTLGPLFGYLVDTRSFATGLSVFVWIFGPLLAVAFVATLRGRSAKVAERVNGSVPTTGPSLSPVLAEVPKVPVDWSGRDLRGADLQGADLTRHRLAYADLRGADLSGADLRLADLTHAKCQDARFDGATIKFCDFTAADLSGAFLRGTIVRSRLDRIKARRLCLQAVTFDRSSYINLIDMTSSEMQDVTILSQGTRAMGTRFPDPLDFDQISCGYDCPQICVTLMLRHTDPEDFEMRHVMEFVMSGLYPCYAGFVQRLRAHWPHLVPRIQEVFQMAPRALFYERLELGFMLFDCSDTAELEAIREHPYYLIGGFRYWIEKEIRLSRQGRREYSTDRRSEFAMKTNFYS